MDALAAALAESMTIPDAERDELERRRYTSIGAGQESGSASMKSIDPARFQATT
ncbi:hypothetical protein [Saccharothrix saharensis]|uniref:hypothetical protein n=1 Tax=Saccharothrix saharensis TaxID=571190 RepID=UPI00147810D6|nr:hypothetical protein [Saccharothrix saharensis]